MKIGILALQGDFAEHSRMIEACGHQVQLIRHAEQLNDLDGLIVPGGESTTIAKLTANANDCIFERIRQRSLDGMPIYGTCMGTIFLSKDIEGSSQGRLALMDISVRRNAFGSQKFSREEFASIAALGSEPFCLVFIRGPIITECGATVDVLAEVSEGIVMARQGNLLVTAFHPELTDDLRVHRYFLGMVEEHIHQRRTVAQESQNISHTRYGHNFGDRVLHDHGAPVIRRATHPKVSLKSR